MLQCTIRGDNYKLPEEISTSYKRSDFNQQINQGPRELSSFILNV